MTEFKESDRHVSLTKAVLAAISGSSDPNALRSPNNSSMRQAAIMTSSMSLNLTPNPYVGEPNASSFLVACYTNVPDPLAGLFVMQWCYEGDYNKRLRDIYPDGKLGWLPTSQPLPNDNPYQIKGDQGTVVTQHLSLESTVIFPGSSTVLGGTSIAAVTPTAVPRNSLNQATILSLTVNPEAHFLTERLTRTTVLGFGSGDQQTFVNGNVDTGTSWHQPFSIGIPIDPLSPQSDYSTLIATEQPALGALGIPFYFNSNVVVNAQVAVTIRGENKGVDQLTVRCSRFDYQVDSNGAAVEIRTDYDSTQTLNLIIGQENVYFFPVNYEFVNPTLAATPRTNSVMLALEMTVLDAQAAGVITSISVSGVIVYLNQEPPNLQNVLWLGQFDGPTQGSYLFRRTINTAVVPTGVYAVDFRGRFVPRLFSTEQDTLIRAYSCICKEAMGIPFLGDDFNHYRALMSDPATALPALASCAANKLHISEASPIASHETIPLLAQHGFADMVPHYTSSGFWTNLRNGIIQHGPQLLRALAGAIPVAAATFGSSAYGSSPYGASAYGASSCAASSETKFTSSGIEEKVDLKRRRRKIKEGSHAQAVKFGNTLARLFAVVDRSNNAALTADAVAILGGLRIEEASLRLALTRHLGPAPLPNKLSDNSSIARALACEGLDAGKFISLDSDPDTVSYEVASGSEDSTGPFTSSGMEQVTIRGNNLQTSDVVPAAPAEATSPSRVDSPEPPREELKHDKTLWRGPVVRAAKVTITNTNNKQRFRSKFLASGKYAPKKMEAPPRKYAPPPVTTEPRKVAQMKIHVASHEFATPPIQSARGFKASDLEAYEGLDAMNPFGVDDNFRDESESEHEEEAAQAAVVQAAPSANYNFVPPEGRAVPGAAALVAENLGITPFYAPWASGRIDLYNRSNFLAYKFSTAAFLVVDTAKTEVHFVSLLVSTSPIRRSFEGNGYSTTTVRINVPEHVTTSGQRVVPYMSAMNVHVGNEFGTPQLLVEALRFSMLDNYHGLPHQPKSANTALPDVYITAAAFPFLSVGCISGPSCMLACYMAFKGAAPGPVYSCELKREGDVTTMHPIGDCALKVQSMIKQESLGELIMPLITPPNPGCGILTTLQAAGRAQGPVRQSLPIVANFQQLFDWFASSYTAFYGKMLSVEVKLELDNLNRKAQALANMPKLMADLQIAQHRLTENKEAPEATRKQLILAYNKALAAAKAMKQQSESATITTNSIKSTEQGITVVTQTTAAKAIDAPVERKVAPTIDIKSDGQTVNITYPTTAVTYYAANDPKLSALIKNRTSVLSLITSGQAKFVTNGDRLRAWTAPKTGTKELAIYSQAKECKGDWFASRVKRSGKPDTITFYWTPAFQRVKAFEPNKNFTIPEGDVQTAQWDQLLG